MTYLLLWKKKLATAYQIPISLVTGFNKPNTCGGPFAKHNKEMITGISLPKKLSRYGNIQCIVMGLQQR